ncbi:hypothetical protein C0J52_23704 [Blattella germanica]|nr:hypothetical protein C0J52_23704 [Blattella germanica]
MHLLYESGNSEMTFFKMSLSKVIRNVLILLMFSIYISRCFSYTIETLSDDDVCSHTKKRRLSVKTDRNSAKIIKETRSFDGWPGHKEFVCKYEVKSPAGDGVIAVIQNLSFRPDENGGCLDYVKAITKGKALKSDGLQMVVNVHQFFTDEYDALLCGKPTISVSSVIERTAAATGSIWSLREILKKINFTYRKNEQGRKYLMERSDIVSKRFKFLRKMKQLRESGRTIVYLDETWVNVNHTKSKVWKGVDNESDFPLRTPIGKGQRNIILHAGCSTGFIPNALLTFSNPEISLGITLDLKRIKYTFKSKDGMESQEFCGHVSAFKRSPDESDMYSFVDPKGEMDTIIHVANKKLTPNCSHGRKNYSPCGPYAGNICIWDELFGDNIVNCPRDCYDESSCFKSDGDVVSSSNVGTKVTVGAITTIILAFILFVTCLWIMRRHRKLCWSNDCSGPRPTPPPTRVEMHPHLHEEDLRSVPTPSAPIAQERASVTISEDKDLPPSYESLFPPR